MAGVGFELQKLVRKGTLFSTVKAFLYGSFLSAGPLILTVLAIGIIGWMSYGLFKLGTIRIFTVTLVYTFAFSLILTGPTQIIFTRLVADKHFSKDMDHIYPAFLTSLVLVTILALCLAIPFYIILKVYVSIGSIFLYKILGILIFLGVCLVWQIMGFISTTKEYQKVVWSYLAGTILSILVAYLLISKISVNGALAGFCAGQWLIIITLIRITTKNLEKKKKWRKEYFAYFFKYPTIVLCGMFYNIGLWIDKFIFWAHFKQQEGASLFYTYNFYDVPNFLAFLTIIPALTYFLILTETNFFKDYKGFVDDVLTQPYLIIEKKKRDMISTLKEGISGMIKMQGIITLLLIIFAEPLLVFLGYKGVSILLFRILLIGVFFHVINLNINIIFLYYEMRLEALLLTMLFTFLNGICTYFSIQFGTPYFGFGFLIATATTFFVSWPFLLRSVKRIDFRIFASQPIDATVTVERKKIWEKIRFVFSRFTIRFKENKNIYAEYHN